MPTTRLVSGPLFVLLLMDSGLTALIFTSLPPILPEISRHFGGGDWGRFVAQMIMTMPSVGLMVGGIVSGWLVDRFGARNVLFGGLIAFAMLGSAGLYLDSAFALLATRLLLGFSATCISTAAISIVAVLYDPILRIRMLGYRNAFGSMTGMLSTFLAGPIAETAGWRTPFSFYLLAVVTFILATAVLPHVDRSTERVERFIPERALEGLWSVYALIVVVSLVMIATQVQLSFVLEDQGVMSPSIQSRVIGVASLGSMLGSMGYGFIQSRVGTRPTLALLLLLIGTGDLIIGTAETPLVAAVGSASSGLGTGLAVPYFINLILVRASVEFRARGVGLFYFAMFFGDSINPMVFRGLSHFAGLQGAFLILGSVFVLGAMAALLVRAKVSVSH